MCNKYTTNNWVHFLNRLNICQIDELAHVLIL